MARLKLFVAAIAVCLVVSSSVRAQSIVDPQLQIGPNPPPAGQPPFPGDQVHVGSTTGANTIGNMGFTIFPNGGGNASSNENIVVIVGTPNGVAPGFTSGTVTYSNGNTSETMTELTGTSNTVTVSMVTYGPFPTPPTSTTTPPVTTSMTANPKNQNAYADLGFPTSQFGGDSESWVNWQGIDASIVDATTGSFGLFVFVIPNATGGLNMGDFVEVSLNGKMPVGSFVVAFSQDSKGNEEGSPFTQAGFVSASGGPGGGAESSVPVPPSALLMGIGGLGLAFLGFNRRRQHVAA